MNQYDVKLEVVGEYYGRIDKDGNCNREYFVNDRWNLCVSKDDVALFNLSDEDDLVKIIEVIDENNVGRINTETFDKKSIDNKEYAVKTIGYTYQASVMSDYFSFNKLKLKFNFIGNKKYSSIDPTSFIYDDNLITFECLGGKDEGCDIVDWKDIKNCFS